MKDVYHLLACICWNQIFYVECRENVYLSFSHLYSLIFVLFNIQIFSKSKYWIISCKLSNFMRCLILSLNGDKEQKLSAVYFINWTRCKVHTYLLCTYFVSNVCLGFHCIMTKTTITMMIFWSLLVLMCQVKDKYIQLFGF